MIAAILSKPLCRINVTLIVLKLAEHVLLVGFFNFSSLSSQILFQAPTKHIGRSVVLSSSGVEIMKYLCQLRQVYIA